MSIEQQVIHNTENSFVRLQEFANFMFPVPVFTSGTLPTTLQRRIEVVVKSGRQVQGVASSLRVFRRESITSRRPVRESLSRPTKQQATPNDKIPFQQAASSVSTLQSAPDVTPEAQVIPARQLGKKFTESDRQVQSMVMFFHDPATQQVIRDNRKSFQQVARVVRELRLYMICTTRLTLLRKPLENITISGQQIQSIVDSVREPASMHATQRSTS